MTGPTETRPGLTGGALTGPAMTGAELTGAELTGAELTGAELTGPALTGAASPDQRSGSPVRVLVLEHDPSDPLLRLEGWLLEAGATIELRRPHVGDQVPEQPEEFDAIISLGGEMGVFDDDVAAWLPSTRRLLVRALSAGIPTFGICLGAQLLAVAGGGAVVVGENGPERGAYLAARRDAAAGDPVFGGLPMTPDVMHYHFDVVSVLPAGATLLLSSPGYPHQAWRQGRAAWAVQFHIETDADDVRAWAVAEGAPLTPRFGPMLDEAADAMAEVWRDVVHRFVQFAKLQATARGDASATTHPTRPASTPISAPISAATAPRAVS